MDIRYRNIACSTMTDDEINATSKLFSEHYGTWSPNCSNPNLANKRIRYTPDRLRREFCHKKDCFVALAYDKDILVGHAFYIRRKGPSFDYITWILQLVVREDYRGHSIGSKIMQSIWGLSDSYACGLYTSNPLTIKALEKATMRPINVKLINKHIEKIKEVGKDLFPSTEWIDNYSNGIVNTNFQTDHRDIEKIMSIAYPSGNFPLNKKLPEGHEWLAFTFSSQKPTVNIADNINKYLEFSENILKQAYSRMEFSKHAWASHTFDEIEYLKHYFSDKKTVLDFGCGQGRHAIECAKRGYDVIGIDFSEANIETAKINCRDKDVKTAKFYCGDVRYYKNKKVDVVLCLYDVIGSYPNEDDNIKILKNAYRNLKKDGILVLSVMNGELTRKKCGKNIVDGIEENIDKLLKLKGSNIMQSSGDIFDGKHMILDDKTGIIYRKEQFFSDDALPIEYVVRDRRYTRMGIINMVKNAGFDIIHSSYVQAGRFDNNLNSQSNKAKEILVIAKRCSPTKKIVNSFIDVGCTWK